MKTSSVNLLTNSASGADIIGDPEKAAAYYSRDNGLQTISWFLNNFVGTILIEATLEEDSATTNYHVIHQIDATIPLTENDVTNIVGNFTWIRASVTNYTFGAISKVSMSY